MSVADFHNTLQNGRTHTEVERSRAQFVLISGVIALVLFVMLAALYGRMMGFGLRRDEMLFVTPAELLGQWQLYQDFFYNHVPYSAWYFRGFHLVFEDVGLLAAARFGVFFAWLLLLSGLGWVTFRISKSWIVALFFVVALLTCEPLLAQAGMAATNNLLPLPFAVLGLGLFIVETMKDQPNRFVLIIAGVCLSIAVGMKVSAVVFIPPVVIGAFLLPLHKPFSHRALKVALPMFVGGILGALPLFWLLISEPQLFLAHILKFHTGPHVAYWQANAAGEPGIAMGLVGKLQLAYGSWLSGAGLVMIITLFYLVWVSVADKKSGDVVQPGYLGQILVVLGVLVLTAGMSLVPTPGFQQYYIQPLVCIPILCALYYRRLPRDHRHKVVPIFGAGLAVLLLLGLPRLGPGLANLAQPAEFTTSKIARGGAALRQAVVSRGAPEGPVATLFPIYPVEAGLPVYPEFATGPFAYRIADFTDPSLAENYTMVGEDELKALFDATPPSAFLLGYDSVLEAPFLQYAQANGYRQIVAEDLGNRYGKGVLLMKYP
ncbi:MAG: hypothetical protein KUG70_13375 [Rhodobacteraceae bacterium]|nr:hypothetical protein [Paracoccaceae bacterium]